MNDVSLRYIADILTERTGQQLTESRIWRVDTALQGIFRERGISNVEQLVCLLDRADEKTLAQEVVEALLNNETYFFRDPAYFEALAQRVLPDLAAKRAGQRHLSIWSAGCSTGQEVFSLAMLFAEQADRWAGWTVEILGTDISSRAIDAARRGCYSQFEIQRGLSVGRMLTFFEETERGWRTTDRMSRLTRFNRHNLLDPVPSAAPFDLILCRNVLLYFDAPIRRLAFDRLAEAITPDGWLMLGAGETVVGQTDSFAVWRGAGGIFRPLAEHAASIAQSADIRSERSATTPQGKREFTVP